MNLEKEIFEIAIEDLVPNRFQPREKFDDESLNELAQSIKEHGVIQPIIVRKIGDKYEIVAGERRYRASKLAGKQTIPALIRNIDDKETAEVALLENLQRTNLTAIEEAKTYQTILKLENITQEELAQKLGKSQPSIANKLRLLNLSPEVQQALLEEKISERHARSLLNIEDFEKQKEYLNRVIQNRMTVKQLDEEIANLSGKEIIPTGEIVDEPSDVNLFSSKPEYANAIFENIPAPATPNPVEANKDDISAVENVSVPITDIQVIEDIPVQVTPENLELNIQSNSTPEEELSNPVIEEPVLEQVEPIVTPQIDSYNDTEISEPLVEEAPKETSIISEVENYPKQEDFNAPNVNIAETPIISTALETNLEETADLSNLQSAINPIAKQDEIEIPTKENEIFSAYDKIEDLFNTEQKEEVPSTEIMPPEVLPKEPVLNETVTTEPQVSNDIYDLRFAINNFRQAIQNTEKFGFRIETEEFDFDNIYQIIIKIDKKTK